MGKWDLSESSEIEKSSFIYHVRVRFADTDQMGIVYHARYFEWFEAARTEMIRSMGMSYKELEKSGISLPVIEAFCRYRMPVKYDEHIRIKSVLMEVTRSRIRIGYYVMGEKEDSVRVFGYTVHCFIGSKGRPTRAPEELLSFFQNRK